jgi:hypothetical protein
MPLAPSRILRIFGHAMYFDGVDDYAAVPNFMLSSQPFSVVMWVRKLNKYYAYGFEWFIRKHSNVWFGEFSITLEPTGHSVFRVKGSDGSENAVRTIPYLEDLAWHNIVAMYDGAAMHFYVDSRRIGSASINKARYITTSDLYIGMHGSHAHYPHTVYQVLIYSRALSDPEIQWNYYNPGNPVRNGLVLWLQADPQYIKDIDGDGVLEWIDLSGYNNHGKIYGATLVSLIKTPTRVLAPARVLPPVR